MKRLPFAMFLVIISIFSCTNETAIPAVEVSFVLDGETFTTRTTQNNYGIETTSSGLYEVFIDIQVEGKSLLLFATTETIEGTFTHLNSIESERSNGIGLCDEVDRPICKTSGKCTENEFTFTVIRQENDPDMLSGTFEGKVCNDQGQTVTITSGSFKNLRQFPNR